MSVSTKRRTALGAAMAVSLLAAGCGSSGNSSGDSDGRTTINVGLFGTFGFKEAGLYDQYMKDHPDIKIVEQSVEQSADYYKALQTHLAANSGLAARNNSSSCVKKAIRRSKLGT